MKVTGQHSFANSETGFVKAERMADEWAGDNEGYTVVIEDFENDVLHVMDESLAEGFMAEWDSRVIYRADHRPRCHYCENVITGQKISVHNLDYCSFVHLDKDQRERRTSGSH